MRAAQHDTFDDDKLLSGAQVRAQFGCVSRMCIHRWQHDPRVGFPPPIKIRGRNYWKAGDLRRFKAGQAKAG